MRYLLAGLALLLMAGSARADVWICNRTSYVLDAALGLAAQGTYATRGWFRIDPGQCRAVMQGDPVADALYVNTRTHEMYPDSPFAKAGHKDLCVGEKDFLVAGATKCTRPQERMVRFTQVEPTETDLSPTIKGKAINLAEEAEYSSEQARLAGVQRLLVMAGFDASPVDGINGARTEAAIGQFLKGRGLGREALQSNLLFDQLLESAQAATRNTRLMWCNETPHHVMAAVGIEENGVRMSRGWYRIEPRSCQTPEIEATVTRLFSFAEAIDEEGLPLTRRGKPVQWGGDVALCTRAEKFEFRDQAGCKEAGGREVGFTLVGQGTTVRFRME